MGKEEGCAVGLWPGSCLHAARALERPRWEDYNYEYLHGVRNRFYWLGDGSTYNEKYMTGDRTCSFVFLGVLGHHGLTFCHRRVVSE
ncbi:hypothetical protein V8E55_011592 [Tylopilus felleus]